MREITTGIKITNFRKPETLEFAIAKAVMREITMLNVMLRREYQKVFISA
jgi:hypothetical protein